MTTVETRYFISSLEDNAQNFANSIRSHCVRENSLHWILDVALNEDDCRIRKENALQNFPKTSFCRFEYLAKFWILGSKNFAVIATHQHRDNLQLKNY